jgi:hypothetical protein
MIKARRKKKDVFASIRNEPSQSALPAKDLHPIANLVRVIYEQTGDPQLFTHTSQIFQEGRAVLQMLNGDNRFESIERELLKAGREAFGCLMRGRPQQVRRAEGRTLGQARCAS